MIRGFLGALGVVRWAEEGGEGKRCFGGELVGGACGERADLT